jgi:hypothetical protein
VNPPVANNTLSKGLTGVSYVLRAVGAVPTPASDLAGALSAGFAVAGYFTHSDGTPNLVGPEVTAEAGQLGAELARRYQRAGDSLDDVGRLIISDPEKLAAVAARVNAVPGPGEVDWRLRNLGAAGGVLALSSRQALSERLIPVAYPVLYDLGDIPNARNWVCLGPFEGVFGGNKKLFQDQADSAQIVGRFPRTGRLTRMAAAQLRAVGRLGSARIRGIPAGITDPLFKDTDDGPGLTKLEFYAPRNFRLLPEEPSRYSTALRNDDWDSLNQFPTRSRTRALTHTVRNATGGGIRDARTAGSRPATAPIRIDSARNYVRIC